MKSSKRKVSIYLKEYEKIKAIEQKPCINLYADELNQLYHLSDGKIFNAMWNSWKMGFVVGFYYARQSKKKGNNIVHHVDN